MPQTYPDTDKRVLLRARVESLKVFCLIAVGSLSCEYNTIKTSDLSRINLVKPVLAAKYISPFGYRLD